MKKLCGLVTPSTELFLYMVNRHISGVVISCPSDRIFQLGDVGIHPKLLALVRLVAGNGNETH